MIVYVALNLMITLQYSPDLAPSEYYQEHVLVMSIKTYMTLRPQQKH